MAFRVSFLAITLAAVIQSVSAAGIVTLVRSTAENSMRGPDPLPNFALPSAIRRLSTINPVTDVSSQDIVCGPDAQVGQMTFPVSPGDGLQFFWDGVLDANSNRPHWPDSIGPIITYITPCKGSCKSFDPKGAPWYKMDQQGQAADNATQWAQLGVTKDDPPYIPFPNVPNGEYLLRHEVIVLKNANKAGGAQFYASCAQLTVNGTDTKSARMPPSSQAVKFPGEYKATDPGILVPQINSTNLVYVFPGGPVLTFGASSSSSSSTTSSVTAGSAANSTATNSTSTIASLNATSTATPLHLATVSQAVPASQTGGATQNATSTIANPLSIAIGALGNATTTTAGGATAAAAATSAYTYTPKPHTRMTPTVTPKSTATGVVAPSATGNSTTVTAAATAAATVAATGSGSGNSTLTTTVYVTSTITVGGGAGAAATSNATAPTAATTAQTPATTTIFSTVVFTAPLSTPTSNSTAVNTTTSADVGQAGEKRAPVVLKKRVWVHSNRRAH